MIEYIEREKAQDGLDNIDWYHVNDKGQLLPGGKSVIETYVPFKAVEEMLKSIPAADVRPVVRAHWYWDKDGMDWNIGAWRCSACHSRPETWWQGDSNSPRNKSGHYYCPNCGADMRGEES